ncbi:unnamed protein product, partial [Pylaiella littoralis]
EVVVPLRISLRAARFPRLAAGIAPSLRPGCDPLLATTLLQPRPRLPRRVAGTQGRRRHRHRHQRRWRNERKDHDANTIYPYQVFRARALISRGRRHRLRAPGSCRG